MMDRVAPTGTLMSGSLSRSRLYAALLTTFAAIAVTLAGLGVYAVLAYGVAQRTREIGIRVALGAAHRDLTVLVLGQALVLVGIGLGVGIGGAVAGTRGLEAMLFGLTPLDPTTYVAVSLLFAAVAVSAAIVPLRRVTRVDSMVALRAE